MKTHRFQAIILIAVVLLLAACNQGTPAQTETESAPAPATATPIPTEPGYPPPVAETVEDSGYPPPVAVPTESAGYPEPGSDQEPEFYATPGAIPEPSSSSGVIVGVVQVNGEPVPNLTIYLAEVLTDGEGLERVASYDRINSPKAYTDESGQFVFSEIRPGRYGLVLDTVLSAYLLHLPQEDAALVIGVEAGEQTEIEVLDYDSLPLPDSGE